MDNQPKVMTWAGWIVSLLVAAAMLASAGMKLMNPPELAEQFVGKFGYPEGVLLGIAVAELICVVLYVIPYTAVLGVVMMTGYLGGAIATHVRVSDNFAAPVIVAVLAWIGVFLRDPRLRALLPVRWPQRPAAKE